MPEFCGRLVDGPCGYYRILTRNLMLEVESTSQQALRPPEVAETGGAYRFAVSGAISSS